MLQDLFRFAAWSRDDRRGATAVEYAIVVSALLLFVLGTMDVGRLMWEQITLDRAVQAAARCAVVNPTLCTTTYIPTYAASQAYGMNVSPAAFTVGSCTGGTKITAHINFHFVTPGVGPNPLPLSSSACQPSAS